jgi:hypothetical protein
MTDQQAPAAAWQAAGPRLGSNVAESSAQFSSLYPNHTIRQKHSVDTAPWNGVGKKRRRSEVRGRGNESDADVIVMP